MNNADRKRSKFLMFQHLFDTLMHTPIQRLPRQSRMKGARRLGFKIMEVMQRHVGMSTRSDGVMLNEWGFCEQARIDF